MDTDELIFRQELRAIAEAAGRLADDARSLRRQLEILDTTCSAVFAGTATYTDSMVSVTIGTTNERLDSVKAALEDAAALAQTVAAQG